MAKKRKRRRPKPWSRAEVKELRKYSKDRVRVKKISREMNRSVGSVRQKATSLRIRLGHRR